MIKTAIVTGASRGLGRALAFQLASAGVRLVLVARESPELRQAASELRARGAEAHPLAADLGDKHAIYQIAGAASALVGPVDLVIHNASTLGPTPLPLLLDTECEDLERVLAVNLLGPFRLSKALAGQMALRGQGTLVHISSDAATSAYPGWGAYGVSKAALDQLARSWAVELDELGVKVVSIDPGEMDTAMHAAALPEADRKSLADPAEVARRIVQIIFEQRFKNGARLTLGGES
jgi:NAD(P)-dependent dehydrogenase (short-subunit alcohol dehydrogenase family)